MRIVVSDRKLIDPSRDDGHPHDYRPLSNEWQEVIGERCHCGALRAATPDLPASNVSRETKGT